VVHRGFASFSTMKTKRESPSAESARRAELERALRALRRGIDPVRVTEELSRRLANKLIHASIAGVTRR